MRKNRQNYSTGFTLVELMVTIAVVGIFASIALPSFARLIESNRINTATNELISGLLLTRSEALKRSNNVTLCPSDDQDKCKLVSDYSVGWIIFLDCDGDGIRDPGIVNSCEEDIIKVREGFDSIYMGNDDNDQAITYSFAGRVARSDFFIGKTSAVADRKKKVVLNRVGRVRSESVP